MTCQLQCGVHVVAPPCGDRRVRGGGIGRAGSCASGNLCRPGGPASHCGRRRSGRPRHSRQEYERREAADSDAGCLHEGSIRSHLRCLQHVNAQLLLA